MALTDPNNLEPTLRFKLGQPRDWKVTLDKNGIPFISAWYPEHIGREKPTEAELDTWEQEYLAHKAEKEEHAAALDSCQNKIDTKQDITQAELGCVLDYLIKQVKK